MFYSYKGTKYLLMNYNLEDILENYNPSAVEHDLILIKQLMKGKKKLDTSLAKDIYYKMCVEKLQFQSYKGAEFLEKLSENITEMQMHEIEKQIADKKLRKQQTKAFIGLNKKIVIGIFAAVFVLCVVCFNWNLILDFRTNYETHKLQTRIKSYESLQNESNVNIQEVIEFDEIINTIIETGVSENQQPPVILDKFKVLYEENSDFSGWLKIEGTKIDYPVMSREGDNNYYLDKNFKGENDKNGLLILDYRSDVLADKQNIIIYGHNMRTGVMFGTLKNYKDKDFCKKHPTISFDSLYEENEYKVIAALLSEVAYEDEDVFRYYDAIDIGTEDNFNEFKEHILQNAIYIVDENLEYGDSYLILSTCDNYKQDGRFVVIAKKGK